MIEELDQLLTLPGDGVYTVHTARDKKIKLLEKYYGNPRSALKKWKKVLSSLDPQKPWILGIPSDNGGGIQRGANWGPLFLREHLNCQDSIDLGDVKVIPHFLHDKYLNTKTIKNSRLALYGDSSKALPVSPLSICEKVTKDLYKAFKKENLPKILGLGGDHSVSYPLVKTWIQSRKHKNIAIIHFDAHTDLLDHRLGVDLCFGTWANHILDDLPARDHLVQLGIRSSGKSRRYWEKNLGVKQLWAKEIHTLGVHKTYHKIKNHLHKRKIQELYISFDIDALDIQYASATGTPEPGGLIPTDCALMIKLMAQDFNISGADLVEVAPFVFPEGVELRHHRGSLQTASGIANVLLEALK